MPETISLLMRHSSSINAGSKPK